MENHTPETPVVHSLASLHAAITALSVQIGKLDERLLATKEALGHHMREEHQEFRDALEQVKEVHAKVESARRAIDEVHAAARVTRWIAGAVAGIVAAWAALRDRITIH